MYRHGCHSGAKSRRRLVRRPNVGEKMTVSVREEEEAGEASCLIPQTTFLTNRSGGH